MAGPQNAKVDSNHGISVTRHARSEHLVFTANLCTRMRVEQIHDASWEFHNKTKGNSALYNTQIVGRPGNYNSSQSARGGP